MARGIRSICAGRESAAAAPVVVFFYGGGWRSGNKRTYRYVAKALARRGYVAVLPDYRIYPKAAIRISSTTARKRCAG